MAAMLISPIFTSFLIFLILLFFVNQMGLFPALEFADGCVDVGLLAVLEGDDEAVLEFGGDFALRA
jgi:hypothetical protein